MRTSVRTSILVIATSALLGACAASGGASPAAEVDPWAERTHEVITAPPITPLPSVEPMAANQYTFQIAITGNDMGTETVDGDVTRYRDGKVYATESASDPRVIGTSTIDLNVDAVGDLGFEWGAYHLENAGGAWDGACTGVAWASGNRSDVTCWAEGSGDYAGLSFHAHSTTVGMTGTGTGMILPLPLPAE